MALEDKKLPADASAEEAVEAAIRVRLEEGRLSCPAAIDAAAELNLPASEVGQAADALRVRLTRCQLGLFGYPGHAKGWAAGGVTTLSVPAGFEDALRSACDGEGRLGCAALWREADRFGVPRLQAGFVADRLGIPIHHCQLGAF